MENVLEWFVLLFAAIMWWKVSTKFARVKKKLTTQNKSLQISCFVENILQHCFVLSCASDRLEYLSGVADAGDEVNRMIIEN